MDIKTSHNIAFAYTVKTLGATVTSTSAYDTFFNKLAKLNIEIEYKVSELDSLGKLHYHGIMYLPKGFYRKRIMSNGYHVKLREVTNRAGWLTYIHKDCAFHDLEAMAEERENNVVLTKSIFKQYNK